MIPNHVDREAARRKRMAREFVFVMACFSTFALCTLSVVYGSLWAAIVGFLFGLFDFFYYYFMERKRIGAPPL